MSALIDYIQKEIHNTYNKKYSKILLMDQEVEKFKIEIDKIIRKIKEFL